MIESLPSEIKDQIKTLNLEARTKRIIKTLHDYLKKHQCRYAPTPLDTCSSAQYSRSLLLLLSLGKLIRRKLKIQPCHCALDTCKSIRIAPTCPDMNIVHYLQALRSINRTLVILKRQERVKEKKSKLLL